MANEPNQDKENEPKGGRRVEVVERNGIVIETTYSDDGQVLDICKWIKPDKRGPRDQGPSPNVEQRPL